MGPCFISTEDRLSAARRPKYPTTLQWGRASSARKTRKIKTENKMTNRASMGPCFISTEDLVATGTRPGDTSTASMGPCFISTEDDGWGGGSGGVADASMGPCFISTEDGMTSPRVRHLLKLQWGRASSARKTGWLAWSSFPTARFNGAVLHQHGRRKTEDDSDAEG